MSDREKTIYGISLHSNRMHDQLQVYRLSAQIPPDEGSAWIYVIITSTRGAICEGVFSNLPLSCPSKWLNSNKFA